jgi:hypothetical protein
MNQENILNFAISQVLNSYLSDMKASELAQDETLKKQFADRHAGICRQFLDATEKKELTVDSTIGSFKITSNGVIPL